MGKEDRGNVAAALKEQIALLSLLVLFAGFVSTDTYYAGFGLRYQTLDLPVDHLMYRGVTALFHSGLLSATYVLVVAWLAAGAPLLAERGRFSEINVRAISYAIVALSVAVAYEAGVVEGRKAAVQDRTDTTSQLPIVQSLQGSGIASGGYEGWRVLIASKDQIVLFQAVSLASQTQIPFTHLIPADKVHELVIRR